MKDNEDLPDNDDDKTTNDDDGYQSSERQDNPWNLSKGEVLLYDDIFPKNIAEEKNDTSKVNSMSYSFSLHNFPAKTNSMSCSFSLYNFPCHVSTRLFTSFFKIFYAIMSNIVMSNLPPPTPQNCSCLFYSARYLLFSIQPNIFQLHLDDFVWKHINSCLTIGIHSVSCFVSLCFVSLCFVSRFVSLLCLSLFCFFFVSFLFLSFSSS